MIDRARSLDDLERHGLQLLAARRWRALGRPVPRRLVAQERIAAATSLAAPSVLRRVRAVYDGDILLVKGPEVEMAYPHAALRACRDVDLLVSDAHAAQRALIAAGFDPVGDERRYRDIHHLSPLRITSMPLLVEVHHVVKWPGALSPPSTAELLEVALPSRCGVEGILSLPSAHHAILLAAHAWAHTPLGHVRQLLDIALVAADAEPSELRSIAGRWGLSGLWRATVAAANAIFGGPGRSGALRLWTRHLPSLRERTVFEAHLASWMSPLWCLTPGAGIRAAAAALAADVTPSLGESWGPKLRRTRLALADAAVSKSRHDATVNEYGLWAPVESEH